MLGGEAEAITSRLDASWSPGLDLGAALRAAVEALAGTERTLTAAELEVAVLSRSNGRRKFARIPVQRVEELLQG